MFLMLNGWEIILLAATVLVVVGVPLVLTALILWLVLRKKEPKSPPVIRR